MLPSRMRNMIVLSLSECVVSMSVVLKHTGVLEAAMSSAFAVEIAANAIAPAKRKVLIVVSMRARLSRRALFARSSARRRKIDRVAVLMRFVRRRRAVIGADIVRIALLDRRRLFLRRHIRRRIVCGTRTQVR